MVFGRRRAPRSTGTSWWHRSKESRRARYGGAGYGGAGYGGAGAAPVGAGAGAGMATSRHHHHHHGHHAAPAGRGNAIRIDDSKPIVIEKKKHWWSPRHKRVVVK